MDRLSEFNKMHRLSEVSVQSEQGVLVLRFRFEPTIEELKSETITLHLSPDLNMDEVSVHLHRIAAIILHHHEEAKKVRDSR